MKGSYKTAGLMLVSALTIIIMVVPLFRQMMTVEPIKKGPGVTAIKRLSDYFAGLKGTAGDTGVYLLDSGKPGGTVLVLGGTHSNEPSGYLSAILLIERAKPSAGRMIVIPFANASAITHTDYAEGSPQKITLSTPTGPRTFRYGSRATNPIDQWPDPDIYVHAGSGQKLSGSETRNLNRAYPGRADGNLTEKIAYGIVQLIKQEKINMSIDLHEAAPEYPVINAIVAHPRAMDIAAETTMRLQLDGIKFGLEPSPAKLRGLSHREWGDATDTLAILMESANPAQGRLRGVTNEQLVLEGKDPLYEQAAKLGRLFVPFNKTGHPISERVARHVTAIHELIKVYSEKHINAKIAIENIPSYQEFLTKGIGFFL